MGGIETGQSAVKIGYMYLPTVHPIFLSPQGNGKSSYEYGIVVLFLAVCRRITLDDLSLSLSLGRRLLGREID